MINSPRYFEATIKDAYAIDFEVTDQLSGYEDDNFVIKCWNKAKYVVKIVNTSDSRKDGLVEALVEVITKTRAAGCLCQKVIPTVTGQSTVMMQIDSGFRKVILLSYIDGMVLKDVHKRKSLPFMELCLKVGEFAGKLNSKMKTIKKLPEVLQREDMGCKIENISDLESKLHILKNDSVREICKTVVTRLHELCIGPEYQSLQKGIIHGDLTLNNLIFEILSPCKIQIRGVVDFMDACMSCYVFEIAATICSVMHEATVSGKAEPIQAGLQTLKSYDDNFPLNVAEIDHIFDALLGRLCVILVFCGYDASLSEKTADHLPFDFCKLEELTIELWNLGRNGWKRLMDTQLLHKNNKTE